MTEAPISILRALFTAAVDAAQPERHIAEHLPPPPRGRTVIVGAGKAGVGMACAVEATRGAGSELLGAVAVPHGTACTTHCVECIEAGHPVPDAGSVRAAERMRGLLDGLTEDDQVLALLSGGGSALLCEPAPGLTLADKQALSEALLRSGASIREINCVRQAVSRIKGGRLALLAAPAPVHTLLVSDVAGDDPATIASGPTVASPFTPADAAAVLQRYGLDVPAPLRDGTAAPPPSAAEMAHAGGSVRVICSPMQSLEAAAAVAREHGIRPLILGDGLEGEAREMGRVQAGIALSVLRWGEPLTAPAVLLSGGEATVSIAGDAGRGGPNAEFALALAEALQGSERIHAIACDTDGIDGSEHNAGAHVEPGTLGRARSTNLSAAECLAAHDAYGFFEALGDLVVTGPTGTNVNDFRAILIG